MSDEVDSKGYGPAEAELLLYDFYKHMTTLILATLGGVLSISQISGIAVPLKELVPALALLLFSGVTALYAMEGLIKARLGQSTTPRWVSLARPVVSGTFGLGVGAFVGKAANLIG